jgi:hypothetical protein
MYARGEYSSCVQGGEGHYVCKGGAGLSRGGGSTVEQVINIQ